MSYTRETPAQTEALERLAEQLKRDHPQSIVGIDSGAVWLSDGVKDWGIFSLYLLSELPVQVYDAKTRTTVLHRPSSERKPEWREILDPRAPDCPHDAEVTP